MVTNRLVLAGWLFLVGSALHLADHLRRGQGSVTEPLYVAGNVALVLQTVVVTLVLTRHRLAPLVAAVAGFPLALGFLAAHWLPTWSPLSDSFVEADAGASPLSFAASGLEIVGAVAVAVAGVSAVRRGSSEKTVDGARRPA